MEKELFLTEKEERTKEAGGGILLVTLTILITLVAVIVSRGWEIWHQYGGVMILVVLIFLPIMLMYPLFLLISGKRARKERKQITENGRVVYGRIVKINEEWVSRPRYSEKMYCLEVMYVDGDGKKKWISPRYKKNPRDYIDIGKEYKLYILGEKCCLEAVEAKRKE